MSIFAKFPVYVSVYRPGYGPKTIWPMPYIGITARIMEMYNRNRHIIVEVVGSIHTLFIVVESLLFLSSA